MIGDLKGMRRVYLGLAALAALAATTGIFLLSLSYFQSEEMSKAAGRLSLYRSTVTAELERFSHLTYVLARDPFVISGFDAEASDGLNTRLAAFAAEAELDAIYLMRPDGLTISASNAGTPATFLGQNYGFRPYFQQALEGTQGRFYGIGATTGLPGYFISDAVRNAAGDVLGVVAIKIDLSKLEQSWQQSGEAVVLANSDGIVLLASDPDWRYRSLFPLTDGQRDDIHAARQFPGQDLAPLDWKTPNLGRAEINGTRWLHVTASDLPHDWALHYFASDDRAVTRSWLVTGSAVLLAGLLVIFFQIQRTRRIGAALRRSEQEEAELRVANDRLAFEIEERRTAERRLKRTQGELERTSRLAALGRLAASVTHELGQPIAAMRNHLAAAEISGGASPALPGQITSLVERMEGITHQLKFFARSGAEDFQTVDLCAAVEAACALVDTNAEALGIEIDRNLPDHPLELRGSQLRVEQVITNLLRNALDAVEEVPDPQVQVRAGQTDHAVWLEVRDTGHGLGAATLADLQEPFMTTRESGRGMGLGLAISAGIIHDHSGTMEARNADHGGAVFLVRFPRADLEEEA